jgi:hypothetical protein
MTTLIYKRTHSGDPDPSTGVFGCADCMGIVRGWSYDAVVGVGGIGKEARENGIAGLLTWIGIGAHKSGDLQRPIVTFDHFLHYGEDGDQLEEIAPNLARRIYAKNVRVIKDGSLTDAERRELAAILKRARKAPPSRGARAERKTGNSRCDKHRCVRPAPTSC